MERNNQLDKKANYIWIFIIGPYNLFVSLGINIVLWLFAWVHIWLWMIDGNLGLWAFVYNLGTTVLHFF